MNKGEIPPILSENNRTEKTSEEIPPTFLKMYEISGHENISMYHFNRYLNDEKRWGENIRTLATIQVNKEKIQYAPENERAALIRDALNSSSLEAQKAAAEMIRYAPLKKQAAFIRDALNKSSPEAQKIAAEMIQHAPLEERAALIHDALNSSSPKAQKVAAKMIWRIPLQLKEKAVFKQIVVKKIREALNSSSPEAQKIAAEMIQHAPLEERAALIRDALNSSSFKVQKIAAEMIQHAPFEEKAVLRQIVVKKIRDALNSSSPEAQETAVRMLRDNFWGREREALFEQAFEKAGNILIEPPLYDRGDIQKERFSREEFFKSGSETTLIGGALKDKVIVRHIPPEHFLSWKALYEDYSFWKENGFDYVPIEPIVSYRLEKDGRVAVFSGVLDLNFTMWQQITSRFGSELEVQRNKILDVLNKKGIKHGHEHYGNFCLRFWRDENGRPDMTKTPRLYLIDFDRAASP